MIFWLIPIGFAVVFLAWFLMNVLKQYDAKSIEAAFNSISEVEKKLDTLQERIEILEAIEAEVILDVQKSKEMPDSAESLSSGRKPLIE